MMCVRWTAVQFVAMSLFASASVAQSPKVVVTNNVGTGPVAIAAEDVDGDGARDLVTANYSANYLTLLRYSGTRNFSSGVTVFMASGSDGPIDLELLDLVTGDSIHDDAVVVCDNSNTLVLVEDVDGARASVSTSLDSTGTRLPQSVVSGVGQFDVIVGAAGDPFRDGKVFGAKLQPDKTFGLTELGPIPVGIANQIVDIATGDLDGDTDTDVVALARGTPDAILLFETDGGVNYVGSIPLTTAGTASLVRVGDFDADTRLDIAVTLPTLFPSLSTDLQIHINGGGSLPTVPFSAPFPVANLGAFYTSDLEHVPNNGPRDFVVVEPGQVWEMSGLDLTSGSFGVRQGLSGVCCAGFVDVSIHRLHPSQNPSIWTWAFANQLASRVTSVLEGAAFNSVFGSKCALGGDISANGDPFLANANYRLTLTGAAQLRPALLLFGDQSASQALAGGCRLYVGGNIGTIIRMTNSNGYSTLPLPIPASLPIGAEAYFQWLVLYSGGPIGNAAALSQGIKLSIGL